MSHESTTVDSSESRKVHRGKRLPPIWLIVAVLLLIAGIVAVQVTEPLGQRADENIATVVLGFLLVVCALGWFTFLSGFPRNLKTSIWILLVLAIVLAPAFLRIEYLSGDLIPTFVLRWSPSADQQLDPPSELAMSTGLTATSEIDFPQFLGPDRDMRVKGLELARDWIQSPPKYIWRQPIGAGWSAFSAASGLAVTMEQRDELEMVTCYEVVTGRMVWWHGVKARHRSVQGGVGPRSTPTIHENRVYALGATGRLHCLDVATGTVIWDRDLLSDFGVTPEEDQDNVTWGRSGAPLIVDHMVIVPAGGPTQSLLTNSQGHSEKGPVSLVAYDKLTGDEIWRGGTTQISYSSPILTQLAGRRQILIVNENNVTGHDPATGDVLWLHDFEGHSNYNASCSQPVPLDGNRVLLSKGYGVGAVMLRVSPNADGRLHVEKVLWHDKKLLKTKLTNVLVIEDHAYALSDGILECVELASGRRRWKRGRYGHGQILGVNDLLLVLSETGELALVQAARDRFVELGRIDALEGQTWNNLCLYDRFLLIRNAQVAACYKLPLAGESP